MPVFDRIFRRSASDGRLLSEVLAEEPPSGAADVPVDIVLEPRAVVAASFVHLAVIIAIIIIFTSNRSLVGLAEFAFVLALGVAAAVSNLFATARSLRVSEEGIQIRRFFAERTLPWWTVTRVEAKPDLSGFRAEADGKKVPWGSRSVAREKRKALALALRARLLPRGMDLEPMPPPGPMVRARGALLAVSFIAVIVAIQVLTAPSTRLATGCTWGTRTPAPTATAASGLASLPPASGSAVPQGTRTLRVVALGDFPAPLLERLKAYFQDRHGITVVIVRPLPLTDDVVDAKRDQLVDERLLQLAASVPTGLGDVTIGLTQYDMEIQSVPRWRFGFSSRSSSARLAVVSIARMDPRCLGEGPDDELLFQRMAKMVGKNVGLLYLGLPPSTDRQSIMYNNILSVADLDRMRDDLPPGR